MASSKRLKTFSPNHLTEEARQSGLLQCPKCGLIWFGKTDQDHYMVCPDGQHGDPVHVVLLCRICDADVSISDYPAHVSGHQRFQR